MKDEIIVQCNADFGYDGRLTPRSITWPNGRRVEISNIIEAKPFETWTGKAGIAYLCRAGGEDLRLFYDHRLNVWYVEKAENEP